MENIRVRFAPSPTGHMHIGNARTALFNYIFIRKCGGIFILRIEDTDQERSNTEAVKIITDSLHWLGLEWGEGYFGPVEEKGNFGPYTQMKRLDKYNLHIEKLVKDGKAYYCFCSEEEIEKKRQFAMSRGLVYKYDGRCERLSAGQIKEKLNNKEKYVVRFKVNPGVVEFEDLIRGKVAFNSDQIGDFVVARSDGVPVYNFAVVVDDVLMEITHVIRGEDHLSNTPRQVLVYQALGFKIPKFAHLPMILGSDRSKLSKRHGETSLLAYKEKGYLPQAMFNYMSLLGWYPKDGIEIRSKEEIIKEFKIEDVGHSGAVFDEKKLQWINHEYIMKLNASELFDIVKPYLEKLDLKSKSREWLVNVLDSIKSGINYFGEIPDLVKVYFETEKLTEEDLKNINKESAKSVLNALKEILSKNEINKDNFKSLVQEVSKKANVKGKDLYMPIRLGTTGKSHGPELVFILPILGSKECINRIDTALKSL